MPLHPAKRHFPEELPVEWEPIRRALEENEDWYRDLVEHSQDLLCVHDLQGRFLSVNPGPARLLGYSVEEMLQKPMRDFIDPQFRDRFDDYLREIERTGESRGLMAVLTRSGEQRIWEYHNTLRTEGVATPIVRGIAHDVTERVLAEKALRATNEELVQTARERERILHELTLFRTLLDQSNDAIRVVDPETLRFLDVNERACVELGYSREELLSMTVFDIAADADESSRARVQQQLREPGFAIIERVHRRKDGTTFPVEVNLRKVRLDREYVVTVSRDITARKRSEERLREFERVVENLEEMIFVLNREYRYVIVNRAFLSHWGMTKEQVVGRLVADVLDREVFKSVVKHKLDECFQGKIVNYEITYTYPEIGERDISVTYLPVEGSAGIDRVVCVLRDITERKRAEEALQDSEARERARAKELETVLEAVPVPVYISHDPECKRITGNRAAYEQLRVPAGTNFSKSAPPVEQPAFRVMQDGVEIPADLLPMQQAAATGEPVYERALTMIFEDGAERETVMNAVPLLDETRKPRGAVGASIDLTELKQAEKALRESEMRFRTVYERSPVGITLVDSHTGRFLQANPKFCEIAGRSEEELLRIDVGGMTHPHDVEHGSEYLQQLAEEKLANYEMDKRYLRPDGSVRWVKILVVPMWSKGEKRRWHMALVQDITERRQAEEQRKRTEEALRQSEERFRVAIKNSPITVFNQDRDLRYTWMHNSRLPAPSGYLGKTPSEFFGREEGDPIAVVRRRVLETGVGVRHEVELTDSGRKRYFDTTIEPVLDSSGAVIGLTGASMDVTEFREASEALREAKKKLTEEKLYLEQEIDTELGFGEIIGQSKALQAVMEQVGKVAASDATVLLLGETGTGKELVARAIHRLSQRIDKSFIKLNCAAIPSGLLESELFGNEKGAFTGAVSRKIGRLELADKGTLFLDEIGEISLALQPKLLRVLQDQEFERLGGTQTLKVDFRLIAATNRDLADVVRQNEFRSDLYYRLNVFPIRIPPLRERREDIRLLVEHFVQKCSQRMNKSITSIPKKTMDALMEWKWPGNVRELENFIERSVILTQGSVLVAPLSELAPIGTEEKSVDETLEATEREHILRALRESHGQIGGLKGAARRLGLKRTTLQSKLKHLGINPRGKPLGQ
jgi:formate hydrogenlyase transcriptional activator